MADVVFVAIMIGFFALAVVFVRACDRIIGPESVDATSGEPEPADERVAA